MDNIKSLEERAIAFFKKETNTDQVTDASTLGVVKLMVMFAKSENSELELLNQELTESNLSLSNDVTVLESKIEELNQDILQSQNTIDELEAEVKQKQESIDKLISSCDAINVKTLQLISEYELLMKQYKESQDMLKDILKKGLSLN